MNPEPSTFDEFTENYYKKVGFTLLHNSEIENYLKLNREDLQRLSSSDCLEIAHLLIRESIFLQQQINKNNAKSSWANSKIDCLTAGKLEKYDKYIPYDKKRLCAINDDEYLGKLNKIILGCAAQNDLLAYLPTYLKHLADTLIELSRVKRAKQ